MKRDLITVVLICLAFYGGLTLNNDRDDAREEKAVEHAIATFEPSPLNCDDQGAISAIRSLAENGAHISHFDVDVYWEYKEGP